MTNLQLVVVAELENSLVFLDYISLFRQLVPKKLVEMVYYQLFHYFPKHHSFDSKMGCFQRHWLLTPTDFVQLRLHRSFPIVTAVYYWWSDSMVMVTCLVFVMMVDPSPVKQTPECFVHFAHFLPIPHSLVWHLTDLPNHYYYWFSRPIQHQ